MVVPSVVGSRVGRGALVVPECFGLRPSAARSPAGVSGRGSKHKRDILAGSQGTSKSVSYSFCSCPAQLKFAVESPPVLAANLRSSQTQ